MATIKDLGEDYDPPQEGPYKITASRTRNGRRVRRYWTRDDLREAQKVAGFAEWDFDQGRDPYDRYDIPDPSAKGATLRQWAEVWVAAQGVEESSRVKMRTHLRHDILPAFGSVVLSEGISRIAVQSWLAEQARGDRPRTGRPPSPKTLANIWWVMKSLTAAAVAEGILDRDPCHGLVVPRAQKVGRAKPRHALTPRQVVELAENMATPRPKVYKSGHVGPTPKHPSAVQLRWSRLTLALAWSGCRWSEQAGLRRRTEDVQLLRRPAPAVQVAEDGPIKYGAGGRYHGRPKSEAGKRVVELIRPVADLYAAQMTNGCPYVWGTSGGKAHDYASYHAAFSAAAARLGHEEWTIHDLRHSHATWLKRCDRRAVQERLGHEPQDVTDVYTHVEAADRVEILRVLNEAWDQAHVEMPVVAAGRGGGR